VNRRETFVVGLLLLIALWVGVRPQSFLNFINPDTAKITQSSTQSSVELAQR
jgi:NADH:ubiquinone oxidoreductase subunit 4 (subunit M)